MRVGRYEMCLSDEQFLSRVPWRAVIVDEAHRLKSTTSKVCSSRV